MGKRKQYGREAWDRAREIVREVDGLPVFTTGGMWTADKLYFVCQYLEQVVRGMSSNPNFSDGLRYIDLFSGCGVSVAADENGKEHRYPGSPVIAASLGPDAFKGMYLVEKDAKSMEALTQRLAKTGFAGKLQFWNDDANVVVDQVASALPSRSLNVAFVDPWSLDIHYETIDRLARQRPLDLIILFSDRIDLQRNIDDVYYPGKSDKLDRFLGKESEWRKEYDALPDRSGTKLRELFAELYLKQLDRIGYKHSKSWPLPGQRGPMFRLVFASKHPLGLKFCEIAQTETLSGERGLFG